jgi:hypothetical protein
MKSMLFPLCQSTARWFLGGALVTLSLLVSPTLQAYQTNFNFNASTDVGWEHWLPEDYNVGFPDRYTPPLTNASHLPTVTFITNNSSAGNMAYFLHAGTTNSTTYPKVGSIFTNGPSLTNFTMTAEFFGWTNGQGQDFGIIGRVQLPVPPGNPPNVESQDPSSNVVGLAMVYCNSRSAKNFSSYQSEGSTDNLRIVWVTPNGDAQLGNNCEFNGPGGTAAKNNLHRFGLSFSPDATSGHYRLILTVNSNDCTGQLVDLSTGLPMYFKDDSWWTTGATNIQRTSFTNVFGSDGTKNPALTNYINVGGAFGVMAAAGNAGVTGVVIGDNTIGQPLDPKFDDFAIVPGVVTLQSAPAPGGPYAQDPNAGIEVFPKRITIPLNGDTRFYRINWIGADHTPTITGIAPGPTVGVITGGVPVNGVSPPVTNVVQTMVLTYN